MIHPRHSIFYIFLYLVGFGITGCVGKPGSRQICCGKPGEKGRCDFSEIAGYCPWDVVQSFVWYIYFHVPARRGLQQTARAATEAEAAPGILWSVHRWILPRQIFFKETNLIHDSPFLLRQGEPGTSQYVSAFKFCQFTFEFGKMLIFHAVSIQGSSSTFTFKVLPDCLIVVIAFSFPLVTKISVLNLIIHPTQVFHTQHRAEVKKDKNFIFKGRCAKHK